MRLLLLAVSLLISMLLVCCTAGKSVNPPSLQQFDAGTTLTALGLPDLPDSRFTSKVYVENQTGAQFFSKASSASVDSDTLQLTSGSNTICWGIWEFSPGLNYLQSVEVLMSVPEGEEAYIALADYKRGAWEIDGPLTIGKQLSLDDARHRSPNGHFYVAVLAAEGNRATVSQLILNVSDGWTIYDVVTSSPTGYLSAGIVDGKPYVVYYVNYLKLCYTRSLDELGTNWTMGVTIDDEGDVGDYCSLAVVNGNPAVAYYDDTDGDLMYVRAVNAAGTDWGTPVIAAGGGVSGKFANLAVINDLPYVAYFVDDLNYLAYAVAEDADGSSWAAPHLIDNEGYTGTYARLSLIDGTPACCYRSDSNLRFAIAGNAEGTLWPEAGKSNIDGPTCDPAFIDMAFINGLPMVSYGRSSQQDLCIVMANDAGCTSWNQPKVIESDGQAGIYTSLMEHNSAPALAFCRGNDADLCYTEAVDDFGENWYAPQVVESEGITGQFCQLLEVQGRPAIAYYSSEAGRIRWAVRSAP